MNDNVNKVIVNDDVLIDLTGDTATESDVAQGKTFHLASGAPAVGTSSGGGADINIATFYTRDNPKKSDIAGAITSGKIPVLIYGDASYAVSELFFNGFYGEDEDFLFSSPYLQKKHYVYGDSLRTSQFLITEDGIEGIGIEISNFSMFFRVIYDETNYETILTAIEAGLTPILVYDNGKAISTDYSISGNYIYFYIHSGFEYGDMKFATVSIDNRNNWGVNRSTIIYISTAIGGSDGHRDNVSYPTTKAVYDYVQSVVGDIDSALQSLL